MKRVKSEKPGKVEKTVILVKVAGLLVLLAMFIAWLHNMPADPNLPPLNEVLRGLAK